MVKDVRENQDGEIFFFLPIYSMQYLVKFTSTKLRFNILLIALYGGMWALLTIRCILNWDCSEQFAGSRNIKRKKKNPTKLVLLSYEETIL